MSPHRQSGRDCPLLAHCDHTQRRRRATFPRRSACARPGTGAGRADPHVASSGPLSLRPVEPCACVRAGIRAGAWPPVSDSESVVGGRVVLGRGHVGRDRLGGARPRRWSAPAWRGGDLI